MVILATLFAILGGWYLAQSQWPSSICKKTVYSSDSLFATCVATHVANPEICRVDYFFTLPRPPGGVYIYIYRRLYLFSYFEIYLFELSCWAKKWPPFHDLISVTSLEMCLKFQSLIFVKFLKTPNQENMPILEVSGSSLIGNIHWTYFGHDLDTFNWKISETSLTERTCLCSNWGCILDTF